MDFSESVVYKFLLSCGYENIEYEPDGNVPPDFVINRDTAIEVRRLNQNYDTNGNYEGLEEVSIPLESKVHDILESFNEVQFTNSWFISFSFKRPLTDIKKELKSFLEEFLEKDLPNHKTIKAKLDCGLEIILYPSEKRLPQPFLLGAWNDMDSTGWVYEQYRKNINLCINEKAEKVNRNKIQEYAHWWLILVDMIELDCLRRHEKEWLDKVVNLEHNWEKVILLDPETFENVELTD